MTNNDIIKKIQLLKSISPDASFASRTKRDVFTHIQKKSFVALVRTNWLKTGAFSFAGAMVALIVGVLIFFAPAKTPAIASLENTQLADELNALSINIQLREITYQNNAEGVIASAINEIQRTETKHLNSSILKEEQKMLSDVGTKNTEIDALLNTIIR